MSRLREIGCCLGKFLEGAHVGLEGIHVDVEGTHVGLEGFEVQSRCATTRR